MRRDRLCRATTSACSSTVSVTFAHCQGGASLALARAVVSLRSPILDKLFPAIHAVLVHITSPTGMFVFGTPLGRDGSVDHLAARRATSYRRIFATVISVGAAYRDSHRTLLRGGMNGGPASEPLEEEACYHRRRRRDSTLSPPRSDRPPAASLLRLRRHLRLLQHGQRGGRVAVPRETDSSSTFLHPTLPGANIIS